LDEAIFTSFSKAACTLFMLRPKIAVAQTAHGLIIGLDGYCFILPAGCGLRISVGRNGQILPTLGISEWEEND